MIDAAIQALARGEFVLLYDFDNRERETDFAIRSDAVTPAHIRQMRKDGGGLICTAVHPVAATKLGLPFAHDVLRSCSLVERDGDIPSIQRTIRHSRSGSTTGTPSPASPIGIGP